MSDHRHTIAAATIKQRNRLADSALVETAGDGGMGAEDLREKAADFLRLARGLSSHSATRRHLIVMAEQLQRQAKEVEKQFEDAAAQRRQDEAGRSR